VNIDTYYNATKASYRVVMGQVIIIVIFLHSYIMAGLYLQLLY